jgi:hypothetical protein
MPSRQNREGGLKGKGMALADFEHASTLDCRALDYELRRGSLCLKRAEQSSFLGLCYQLQTGVIPAAGYHCVGTSGKNNGRLPPLGCADLSRGGWLSSWGARLDCLAGIRLRRMRYLNDDLNQPSPLFVRLWEARRGLFVGLITGAFWLGLLVGALFALAAIERGGTGTNYGLAGLWFLWRLKGFLLLVGCYSVFLVWMRELSLVNEDSETLERIVDRRLRAVEQRVFAESLSQPEQPKTP